MARVKAEEIVDHLSSEFRAALEISVNEVIPGAKFDSRDLFKAFKLAVSRKCSSWEVVPDSSVEK